MNNKRLKVSFVKDKINPKFPCYMEGYGDRVSNEQKDDLEIRSLLIDSNELIIFHVLDIILIEKEFADRIKKVLFEKFSLKENQIILEATHTHSGPKVSNVVDRKLPINQDYIKMLEDIIIKNTENCLKNKKSAKAFYGDCIVDGFYSNRNNLKMPFNNKVYTIKFKSSEDEDIVSFINIACHPTALDKNSNIISSDYIGYLRNKYYELTNTEAIVVNGECGDVSTRFLRKGQDFLETKRIGEGIAEIVAKTNNFKEVFFDNMRISKFKINIKINPKSEEFLLNNKRKLENMLEGLDHEDSQYMFLKDILLKNIEYKMSFNKLIYEPTSYIYETKDFRFVTIPGELVYNLGYLLRSKDEKPMFINAYSNDYNGYAVDKNQYGKYQESFFTNYPYGKAEELIEGTIDLYS